MSRLSFAMLMVLVMFHLSAGLWVVTVGVATDSLKWGVAVYSGFGVLYWLIQLMVRSDLPRRDAPEDKRKQRY